MPRCYLRLRPVPEPLPTWQPSHQVVCGRGSYGRPRQINFLDCERLTASRKLMSTDAIRRLHLKPLEHSKNVPRVVALTPDLAVRKSGVLSLPKPLVTDQTSDKHRK